MRLSFLVLSFLVEFALCQKRILLTNDDGWATGAIRAQYEALRDAGYDIILSAPAVDMSGTGPLSADPIVVIDGCEFDTCPPLSPPEGSDPSDARINYVNAFPADSVKFGIRTLAPKFFNGSPPDFVVSGPNTGHNLGIIIGSGTVGAASEAAKEGVPSVAISGTGLPHASFTTLDSDPTSPGSLAARIYGGVGVRFVNALLADGTPILPPGISINVNYVGTNTTTCSSADDFKFILTRLLPDPLKIFKDVRCFASVSVFQAKNTLDADASTQQIVLDRLSGLLSCLPK
ncbi:acid phosphatase [Moniliophthora roreri MCA 2997]|uniref:Acid phosphatase n=1 Tax=Moniliophthora roreri (strain MCA 2997) TaxID=1381753 RepID=V2XSS3_MONRO|nr:acid phosphatase [Moniliophthora roreri MCA 2997]